MVAICIAVDRPLRAVVWRDRLAFGVGARHLMSLTHCLATGADSGGWYVLRQKTQVGGRSNRAIVARPTVFSAHEGESKGDRENPESNGLGLITE